MPKTHVAKKTKAQAGKPAKKAAPVPKAEPKVKPKAKKRAKLTKTMHPCECGCGALVRARFVQGHDAKLKSQLLSELRLEETPAGRKQELIQQLKNLGWYREGMENPRPKKKTKKD